MVHPAKILAELGIHPAKALGQNFLVEFDSILPWIPQLKPDDTVLEIGPGLGGVTNFVKDHVKKIILVEKDFRLAEYLKKQFPDIDVLREDILNIKKEFITNHQINVVIGNLPFYITTPILEKCFVQWGISLGIFGVQKEFAERLLASHGNSLAIFFSQLANIQKVSSIPANAFYPKPKVDASWIVMEKRKPAVDIKRWELLLRGSFWGKRKSLKNAFLKNPHWSSQKFTESWKQKILTYPPPLDLNRRADSLSVEEFLILYNWLNDNTNK
ncbi:MAG: ribosomal RNA small subunit methyltransferase A [Candidatus Hydrogenedentota bacterium]|nr:MAG: ribosomal RNA small subunit methyltransferase A [Candidatus Hydrogenedentota bacterium]